MRLVSLITYKTKFSRLRIWWFLVLNFPILLRTPSVWFTLHYTTLVALSEIYLYIFFFIVCRYRTCCCFNQYCCWKFCWLEVFGDIWYNSEIIYCWIRCIRSDQLGFGVFFCIYYHSICTSSCWIWYSWNQGLLKWWVNSTEVLKFELDVDHVRFPVHLECWFSFMFRSWYSRHPSFQNFSWKGVMDYLLRFFVGGSWGSP